MGRAGGDNIEVEDWEVQTIGCKIGHRDVLYNTGNIANFVITKWKVTFKNCINFFNFLNK